MKTENKILYKLFFFKTIFFFITFTYFIYFIFSFWVMFLNNINNNYLCIQSKLISMNM